MKLVIDANILISALIKNGITRRIISENDIDFYAPEFLISEIKKHENMLLEKTKSNAQEFSVLFEELNENIIFISNFDDYIEKAITISPDIKDAPYFALALKLDIPIWSNDSALKNQDVIKVINTKELIEFFN